MANTSSRGSCEGIRQRARAEGAEPTSPTNGKQLYGRRSEWSFFSTLFTFLLMFFSPVMMCWVVVSCSHFSCDLSGPAYLLLSAWNSAEGGYAMVAGVLPPLTKGGFQIYGAWFGLQLALYFLLPGRVVKGAPTPYGQVLKYKVNGVQCSVASGMAVFLLYPLYRYHIAGDSWLLSASLLARYYQEIFWPAHVIGLSSTVFVYAKAYFWPDFSNDSKFTGSHIYDCFMGVELNPRFPGFLGKLHDMKLFYNGRPGLGIWPLISFSVAAHQYLTEVAVRGIPESEVGLFHLHPHLVPYGTLAAGFLHFTYCFDFFLNEEWYLTTIDMALDHFGFMMAWGDCVWVTFLYSLSGAAGGSCALTHNRGGAALDAVGYGNCYAGSLNAGWQESLVALSIGMFGYLGFRLINHEKDYLRAKIKEKKANPSLPDPKTLLGLGTKATWLEVDYVSGDGVEHKSTLITAGFWGWARHLNYSADLLLTLGMGLCATGVTRGSLAQMGCGRILSAFSYSIFMFILLNHRVYRDESKLRAKYGQKNWDSYCNIVRARMIPYLY